MSAREEHERLREDNERLRAEVARLHSAVDAERAHATQWREVAEERRATLERLRQHPAVRLLLGLSAWVRPIVARVRQGWRRGLRVVRRSGAALLLLPHRLTSASRERSLRSAVGALPPSQADPRTVSVIVLTRDGAGHLERLLPALRRCSHPDLEVIVFDNGSGQRTREMLDAQHDVVVVRSETNLTFSAANNRAAEQASGEVICFLNDDVEPLEGAWLDIMLAALTDGVGAVGAQLVYPRRRLLHGGRARDLTVQHRGILFEPVPGGVPQARNADVGEAPTIGAEPQEVAAVTAACLLIRRDDFVATGGFDERYVYGAEDVDLCWRLRRGGQGVLVVPDAVLLHHEGATRHRADPDELAERQRRNWERLAERYGPELTRAVTLDRLRGDHCLAARPYEVAITITRDLPEAGYGDWYTAHELGVALEDLGWRVRYVEKYRDAWYDDLDGVDAIISLLDTFDLRRVARPGLVKIAWVRNWTERWLMTPWFGDYDVVLVASETAAQLVRERSRHRPHVLPLATNPDRFRPDGPGLEDDDPSRRRIIFPGNHWGRDTRAAELVRALDDLEVFGRGWDEVPEVADRWRGHLDYDRLPALYREAAVVVDQAAMHTRADGSLNARVFDAIAAGALPVTDQVAGAREVFGELIPVYSSGEDLAELVWRYRDDPGSADGLVAELREIVLDKHTYTARARQVREILVGRAEQTSFVLQTSAPNRDVAETWGDWHLAEALARELRARGHQTTCQTADEWGDQAGRSADVAIHLKGRSSPRRADGQVHVIWNISHPEELTTEECDAADLVLVASRRFPEVLRQRTTTTVGVLLQATDERRFRPNAVDPQHAHDVAFVGNSRFVMRDVVRDALAAGLRPAVYGANWDDFVDPDLVQATFVDNAALPTVYSSVKVLLNDHWEGMRRHGFVSNRIFDALACATCVVSDDHPDLVELFGGAVAAYREPEDLRSTVDRLLGDPELRRRRGDAGRRAVLDGHTFAHRADELLEAVLPLVDAELGGKRDPA